jgi:mannosyltransferase
MIAVQVASAPMRGRFDARIAHLAQTLGVFTIALAVRLYGLDSKPYWMDEITTIERSSLPFLALVTDSLTFHHFPTYFLLVSWFVPFGVGETMLRLPSVLCGALTCSVAAGIGRAVGGGPAGLMAGLLMAFSPLQVSFSQEARPSALAVLFITISLHGLVQLARDPKSASLSLRDPGANRRAWVTYFGATLAALYVLGVALFWAVAAWLAMLFIARHRDANSVGFLRNSIFVHGAIAILILPGYVAMFFFVHAYGRVLEGLDWILPVTLQRLSADITSVYLMQIASPISSRVFPSPIPFMHVIAATLAGLGALSLWRNRSLLAVLALAVMVLPFTLLAISTVFPLWLTRYLLWSAVPFFILAGLGIALLPRWMQGAGVSIIATLAFINLTPYYWVDTKPRWDLAAASLQPAIRNDDLVLVADVWVPRMMNVYLARKGDVLPRAQWTTDVDVAITGLADGRWVWAVFGRVGQVDRENLESFLHRISPLGSPAAEMRAGLDVVILKFAAPAVKTAVNR